MNSIENNNQSKRNFDDDEDNSNKESIETERFNEREWEDSDDWQKMHGGESEQ